MTAPATPESGPALTPRRRKGPAAAPQPYLDEEVARGQADALLGALGRMQLRLDVLAREQADAFDRVVAALDGLSARLEALEQGRAPHSG